MQITIKMTFKDRNGSHKLYNLKFIPRLNQYFMQLMQISLNFDSLIFFQSGMIQLKLFLC